MHGRRQRSLGGRRNLGVNNTPWAHVRVRGYRRASGRRERVYAMQYEIALPAGYDMGIIRRRVAMPVAATRRLTVIAPHADPDPQIAEAVDDAGVLAGASEIVAVAVAELADSSWAAAPWMLPVRDRGA
jgi:hypothetical protein